MNSFAYININPIVFDKKIDNGGEAQEYTINNITNRTLKYRVYVEKNSEKFDMTQWAEVYPKNITVRPGEEKTIKLYINSPLDTPNGEYSTTLGLKEIGLPNVKKNRGLLEIYTNLKIKIYGYVGKMDPKLEYKNLKVLKGKFIESFLIDGDIKNNSGRRVNLEFLLSDGKQNYLLGESRVKKDEVLTLNKLKIFKENKELQKNYSNIKILYIQEKGSNKSLKTIEI